MDKVTGYALHPLKLVEHILHQSSSGTVCVFGWLQCTSHVPVVVLGGDGMTYIICRDLKDIGVGEDELYKKSRWSRAGGRVMYRLGMEECGDTQMEHTVATKEVVC